MNIPPSSGVVKDMKPSSMNNTKQPDSNSEPSKPRDRVVKDVVTSSSRVQQPIVQPVHVPITRTATVSTKKVQPPAAADDYDDDFEAYDDDFENDEEDVKPPPVQAMKAVSSKAKSPQQQYMSSVSASNDDVAVKDIVKSLQSENQAALERQQRNKEDGSSSNSTVRSSTVRSSGTSSTVSSSTVTSNTVSSTVSSARRVKKYGGSMALSAEGSLSLDPRYRRVRKLLSSGVLDLQEESSNQLNIVPSTKHDLYSRLLRSPGAGMRQIGVPADLEVRDVECYTDEVLTEQKDVQCSYGDDTTLLHLIKAVKNSRTKDSSTAYSSTSTGTSTVGEEEFKSVIDVLDRYSTTSKLRTDNTSTSTKLASFLQTASTVMEGLLREAAYCTTSATHEAARVAKARDYNAQSSGLFAKDVSWQYLGSGTTLLQERTTAAVRHSELQPHVLITAHAPIRSAGITITADSKEGKEKKTNKSKGSKYLSKGLDAKALYCIWDASQTQESPSVPIPPMYVLESSGIPTACTFSKSQTFIVLAGTLEGCLYLWDLREASAYHKNILSEENNIDRGIRKPCYSTNSGGGGGSGSNDGASLFQHSAPIVQVESLGDATASSTTAVVSNFVSLDLEGMLVLWITNDTGSVDDSLTSDRSMSPWSTVKLIQARVLHAKAPTNPLSLSQSLDFSGSANCTALATIPGDYSSFLVSAGLGTVVKVTRFGEAPPPLMYNGTQSPSADVTSLCILTLPKTPKNTVTKTSESESFHPERALMLLSRADGSVDLFDLTRGSPIYSWNINSFKTSENKKSENKNSQNKNSKVFSERLESVGACLVRWCPSRLAAFLVVDALGAVYFFDLLADLDRPVLCSTSNGEGSNSLQRHFDGLAADYACSLLAQDVMNKFVDISMCRPGSTAAYMSTVSSTVGSAVSGLVKLRRLNDDLFASSVAELAQERLCFHELLEASTGRVAFDSVFRLYDEETKA